MKYIIIAILSLIIGIATTKTFYANNNGSGLRINAVDAHKMIVNYRMDEGVCNSPSPCSDYRGIWELSKDQLSEINSKIYEIENCLKSSGVKASDLPTKYRFFVGEDNNGYANLIFVGLKTDNTEYETCLEMLSSGLPCPVVCDKMDKSKLLNGDNLKGENCCK